MVTTASRELISEWLAHPRPLSEEEQSSVKDLLREWPWLVPAHYLKAGAAQSSAPFSPEMLGEMQLYAGNWLLFHQMMEAAANAPAAIPEPAEEPVLPEELRAETPPEPAAEQAPLPQAPAHPSTLLSSAFDPPFNPEEPLIHPIYTEDYFLHQGIRVDERLPEEQTVEKARPAEDPRSLMVVMSFSEWLQHFRHKSQKEREEEEDKRALKSHWQKEKLAAALEEEDDEIPETVFEMAVNSISREDGLVSESLAEILVKQGKTEAAIEMYRKLSLRNPAKSAYFAAQIEKLQTEHNA